MISMCNGTCYFSEIRFKYIRIFLQKAELIPGGYSPKAGYAGLANGIRPLSSR